MEKFSNRRKFIKSGGAVLALGAIGIPESVQAALEKETLTPRYAMAIDLRRCVGCRGCTVACKSEFQVPLGKWQSCVQQKDSGTYPQTRRHFLPLLCNHCANSPCVEICPVDPVERIYESPEGESISFEGKATYQRPDGVVLVDEDICVGCGACIVECPYGARFFHPLKKAGGDPVNNSIGKCTYCAHRIDKGVVPSCVNTCLGKARIFGDINNPDSEISKLLKMNETQVLTPEKETEPHTFYIALEPGVYQQYQEEEGFHDEIK